MTFTSNRSPRLYFFYKKSYSYTTLRTRFSCIGTKCTFQCLAKYASVCSFFKQYSGRFWFPFHFRLSLASLLLFRFNTVLSPPKSSRKPVSEQYFLSTGSPQIVPWTYQLYWLLFCAFDVRGIMTKNVRYCFYVSRSGW